MNIINGTMCTNLLQSRVFVKLLEVVFESRASTDFELQQHFQIELNYHYNTVCRSMVFSRNFVQKLERHVQQSP